MTTFSGWVPGGTYVGRVENGGAPSALPTGLVWRMTTPVTISSNQSLPFTISTVLSSVNVLAGGLTPLSRCAGPTADPKVIFRFAFSALQKRPTSAL
jgi:hypothetical protein